MIDRRDLRRLWGVRVGVRVLDGPREIISPGRKLWYQTKEVEEEGDIGKVWGLN